jgi:hypothetical protein
MRDANYAPRNFATLGQLGLLPPFAGLFKKSALPIFVILQRWAEVRLYTLFFTLQSLVGRIGRLSQVFPPVRTVRDSFPSYGSDIQLLKVYLVPQGLKGP